MRLDKLTVLYNRHRHDLNYHFKDLGEEVFTEYATRSFAKLHDDQKLTVRNSFAKEFGAPSYEAIPEEDKANFDSALQRYRFLSQTNLFFLCQLLEKYNQTTYDTHEEICNAHFVQKSPLFSTLEHFANQYTDLKETLLLVPRGGFKALDLDTGIPTPNGMRKIRDIHAGDVVFGSNGRQCNVTGESSVFTDRKCYEIKFSTGESFVADADHLWVTDSRKDRDRLKGKNGKNCGPKPSVKTTQEIFDTLLCRGEHNHRVAISEAVDISDKEYTIPPYVLGCWLGDGTSSNSNFTCDPSDEQIIREISNEGQIIRKAEYSKFTYVSNGGTKHSEFKKRKSSLLGKLRTLGVINNKHIPEEYLFGSYAQRLSLLQGLMDTDGTCDKRGHCTFTNTNKSLAEGVRQLVASLGLKPFNICEYDTMLNGVVICKGYQVGFIAYSDFPVFRLNRKKERQQPQKKVTLSNYRQIVSVEEVETRETKCIMVDSEDHTYLIGSSYITTHNSSIDMADCVQWIICYPAVTIAILTGTLPLAKDFVGEIKDHFTLEESNMNDSKGKMIYVPRKLSDRDTGEWSNSLFQALFAEHCIKPTKVEEGTQIEFQTPAGGDEKEPTVRAASIEQALSGAHFCIMKLDDVVTNENSQTIDRILKINKQISINKAMLHPYGFFDVIGTWYDECLTGETFITMSDWSQKPVKDVKVGDYVVGFTDSFGKRSMLVRSKVTHTFEPTVRKVFKYTFASGRAVTGTDSHLWWKGANGNEPTSYAKIGLEYHKQKFVRRLLTPRVKDESRDAGYLSGLYDGEGSFQKNKDYPSGVITLCQTQHNPEVVNSMHLALESSGFDFTEDISNNYKHEFKVLGGWQSRYKFLSEVDPVRRDVIEESLYGQNKTEKDFLVSVEEAGEELTYCFETETGNYIADGCCSHNCDYYGLTIKHEEKVAIEDGLLENIRGSVDSGRFNSHVAWKVYLRAAWWPTEEAKKAGKIEEEMKREDWILWFPERLNYAFLKKEKRDEKSEGGFEIKYLNDPRKINKIKLPRELLVRRTIPHTQFPQQKGVIVTVMDAAYSTKSWADYTVIITALIFGGRFYILNMRRGRFSEYELPQVIANVGYKWKPKRIAIEDSVGVKWLQPEIRREMNKLRISIPLEFCSLGLGTKRRSKLMKAKPVVRLLGDERLLFLNSCEGLEEIYTELEKFTGTDDDAHDDIVSALSLLVDQFIGYADMDARINAIDIDYVSDQVEKARHDQIYCLGKYARLNENGNSIDDNPVSTFERERSGSVVMNNDPYFDPLGDLR